LPPVGCALSELEEVLPEMEFWFPSHALDVGALDRLCRRHLLGATPRPTLPERHLHGMLKGFTDLVFECQGRYWVLDYKSNALGPGDAAYTQPAMAAAMAEHRYDIQGAIYLLALHRLLRARLGERYDPAVAAGRRRLPVPARDRQRGHARLLPDRAGHGPARWTRRAAGT
jgi:exodeoxyribonuclease V beta subunit